MENTLLLKKLEREDANALVYGATCDGEVKKGISFIQGDDGVVIMTGDGHIETVAQLREALACYSDSDIGVYRLYNGAIDTGNIKGHLMVTLDGIYIGV